MSDLAARIARANANLASTRATVDFGADCFPVQRAVVDDAAPYSTIDGGRRCGKSEALARKLCKTEQEKPRAPLLYFAPSRGDAKRIIHEKLCAVIAKHGLGLEWKESSHTFARAGRDRIYLTGCNNATEIGKMRGSGWGAVAGDEAQLFPAYLKPLVEDTLTPALMDFDGWLVLSGTPAPVPTGYFYDCVKSAEWMHHKWTPFDNPHVNARKRMLDAIRMRGVTEAHPSIQREFFGRWVYDATALVVQYDAIRNGYVVPGVALTDFVFGVDLGFDDADAIAVLGWHRTQPNLYLVEEHVLAKQSITELAERLRDLHAKYAPLATVVDTGGLGKKITDEIRRRTGLPLEPAEKERKLEHIELLNDALRTGRFFARTDSRFARDAMLVEWDRSNPEKPKISDRYHSDVIDAVLYAYRRALHWLHEPRPEGPQPGTQAAFEAEERELEAATERRMLREHEEAGEYGSY